MIGPFVFCVVLPLLAPPAQAPAKSSRRVLPAGQDRVSVPLEFKMNQVRLDAMVNGKGPFHLVLDTGMPIRGIILFSGERVDALKLGDSGQRAMIGGAGSEKGGQMAIVAPDVSVELGELKLPSMNAIVMPDRTGMPPGMDGIIGGELFFQFAVRIDLKESRLDLIEPSAFEPPSGAAIVPLDHRGGMVFVDVGVTVGDGEPQTAHVVVDIGAGHAISLNTRKDGAFAPPKDAVEAALGHGVSGAIRGQEGRVRRLEIGGVAFENVVASFPIDAHKNPGGMEFHDGNLGEEILRRFTVTFDYEHDRMVLERGDEIDQPFEGDMLGIGSTWTKDGAFVIDTVLDGSAAAAAGLQVGDEIVKVDGRTFAEIGEGGLRAILRVDGAEVVFTLKRGDETVEKRARLHRRV